MKNELKLKEKMKTMREFFDYVCKFGTDSVQGTAGLISTKDIKDSKKIILKMLVKKMKVKL